MGTDLRKADLRFAHLDDAYLLAADPSGADLSGSHLNRALLCGAKLSRANLTTAKNLAQDQLDYACGTDAKLPQGLTLKPCPPDQPCPRPDHK
jgi:uncharacterized protein YjbI with pentapeptide repeats